MISGGSFTEGHSQMSHIHETDDSTFSTLYCSILKLQPEGTLQRKIISRPYIRI